MLKGRYMKNYLLRCRVLTSVATVVLLGGCAANKPQLTTELQSELEAPLYCEGEEQCKTMWERATFFVSSNAGFKIQIHNDTVIQTYNPMPNSPKLAFSISREPLGSGRYQIWTKAWCDNMFGCHPNHFEAIARAKRYIRTGTN